MNNTLYPDSNVWFSYSQTAMLIKHGETLINLESLRFGNTEGNGSFYVPYNARAVDAKVTSYSGPYWTDKLEVNSSKTTGWENVYALSSYGSNYESLGDPYTVNIPPEDMGSGMNLVNISTGKNSSASMNASPYDRVIYTIAASLSAASSEPKKKTEGCNWTVEFFDGEKINLSAPPEYAGPKQCNYTNASIAYDEQSSVDDAVYQLFKQLDLQPEDGRLDVKFNPDDVIMDLTTVGGIRSLWGPIRVKLILKA
jgi:hypothetical protein